MAAGVTKFIQYSSEQLTIANFDRVKLSVISIDYNSKTSSNFDKRHEEKGETIYYITDLRLNKEIRFFKFEKIVLSFTIITKTF